MDWTVGPVGNLELTFADSNSLGNLFKVTKQFRTQATTYTNKRQYFRIAFYLRATQYFSK